VFDPIGNSQDNVYFMDIIEKESHLRYKSQFPKRDGPRTAMTRSELNMMGVICGVKAPKAPTPTVLEERERTPSPLRRMEKDPRLAMKLMSDEVMRASYLAHRESHRGQVAPPSSAGGASIRRSDSAGSSVRLREMASLTMGRGEGAEVLLIDGGTPASLKKSTSKQSRRGLSRSSSHVSSAPTEPPAPVCNMPSRALPIENLRLGHNRSALGRCDRLESQLGPSLL